MTASPQIEALAENPVWVGDLRTTLGPTTKRIDGCTLADEHVAGEATAARRTRAGRPATHRRTDDSDYLPGQVGPYRH
jgi:hypothetical protein